MLITILTLYVEFLPHKHRHQLQTSKKLMSFLKMGRAEAEISRSNN